MHMWWYRDKKGSNDVMSFLCLVQSTMPQWNSFALGDDNGTCMDSCFAKKVMHMWFHRMLWRFLPEVIEIKATRMHMSKCKKNPEPHLLGLPFASCAASEPQLRGFWLPSFAHSDALPCGAVSGAWALSGIMLQGTGAGGSIASLHVWSFLQHRMHHGMYSWVVTYTNQVGKDLIRCGFPPKPWGFLRSLL